MKLSPVGHGEIRPHPGLSQPSVRDIELEECSEFPEAKKAGPLLVEDQTVFPCCALPCLALLVCPSGFGLGMWSSVKDEMTVTPR